MINKLLRSFLVFSRCRNPVDVAFLVDSSGSLGKEGFRKQKDFIKAVTQTLDISYSHSRAGVITYSDRASVAIAFSDYIHKEEFNIALEALPYHGKTTRIDKAIVKASRELMTRRRGRREDIPGVMVIITDGRQTPDLDVTPLEEVATSLETLGITTLVLGIGELADEEELRKMTARDDDVFHAPSLQSLSSFVRPLSISICKAAGICTALFPCYLVLYASILRLKFSFLFFLRILLYCLENAIIYQGKFS